jgi:hypothetical protein
MIAMLLWVVQFKAFLKVVEGRGKLSKTDVRETQGDMGFEQERGLPGVASKP